jgi:hypothetical protein
MARRSRDTISASSGPICSPPPDPRLYQSGRADLGRITRAGLHAGLLR